MGAISPPLKQTMLAIVPLDCGDRPLKLPPSTTPPLHTQETTLMAMEWAISEGFNPTQLPLLSRPTLQGMGLLGGRS